MKRIAILVLAAGRGERLGGEVPKAFVVLRGASLLERSLATVCAVPEIDWVQPVVAARDMRRYASLDLAPHPKLAAPIPGGIERQDSVAAGLEALPREVEYVAVHDAARCLVGPDEIRRVLAAAREHGAALLARPLSDTLKRVREGAVIETPPRREYWAAQTPQAFRRDWLCEAMEKARAEGHLGTDDAELVERLGVAVRIVEGTARNLKITAAEDLAIAEDWLAREAAGADRAAGRS